MFLLTLDIIYDILMTAKHNYKYLVQDRCETSPTNSLDSLNFSLVLLD